jgi:hypothetical protein
MDVYIAERKVPDCYDYERIGVFATPEAAEAAARRDPLFPEGGDFIPSPRDESVIFVPIDALNEIRVVRVPVQE